MQTPDFCLACIDQVIAQGPYQLFVVFIDEETDAHSSKTSHQCENGKVMAAFAVGKM